MFEPVPLYQNVTADIDHLKYYLLIPLKKSKCIISVFFFYKDQVVCPNKAFMTAGVCMYVAKRFYIYSQIPIYVWIYRSGLQRDLLFYWSLYCDYFFWYRRVTHYMSLWPHKRFGLMSRHFSLKLLYTHTHTHKIDYY